jgi:phosphotriesterase-related protein
MTVEMKAAKAAGIDCMVSTQAGMPGPDLVAYLSKLSQDCGMRLINSAAYYNKANYPKQLSTQSEDEIADGLVKAAASARMGALGEFGVANGEAEMDPVEKKVFRAVAKAQVRTGLPIFTHNNYSTGPAVPPEMALYQLDELESAGGIPASIALGHVCCHYDPKADIAKRLAKRGAFVAFDRVTRQQQWVTDEQRIMMILAFLDAGYGDQLLISSDYIGRINTSTGEVDRYGEVLHARDGGPGYARPIKLFVPQLKKAGVSDKTIRRIMHENPLRFLSFVPKEA